MGAFNLIGQLVRHSGLYGKSLGLFLVAGIIVASGVFGQFSAQEVPQADPAEDVFAEADATIVMRPNGALYLERSKLNTTTSVSDDIFRVRYVVLDRPEQFIDKLTIFVTLPKPITEDLIGHRLINNGGALRAQSELRDSQTVAFHAEQIGTESQLALEIELPKSYISSNGFSYLKEKLSQLPAIVWTGISIGLPVLTLLILFMMTLARTKTVPAGPVKLLDEPPNRLAPAMIGILLHGRISSRELAATLIDLARRGHLIIRQVKGSDFRFARRRAADHLEPFESELLDQIFGPTTDKISAEEMSFAMAQELFSKRVSQAFLAAYQRINDLGFFYTNPLRLHRRYQLIGLLLFVFGLVGFFTSAFLLDSVRYLALFWLGMIGSSLLITYFAKSLPVRTVFGDRELSRWLAFKRYLAAQDEVSIGAHTQEHYLSYLPYAIVFECEVEWTKRFYDLPFAQPHWYVAPGITTIDEFANKVFPLFGYLSHVLALSSAPANR